MVPTPGVEHPVVPQRLVTVAFLKARVDSGADHLEMFVPLVTDAVSSMAGRSFTAPDIQNAVGTRHGLAMPQHTVSTLLRRLEHRHVVGRQYGRYVAGPQLRALVDIPSEKARIEAGQRQLASSLRAHAATRGLPIGTDERALQLILGFVEEQQLGMLLDDGPPNLGVDSASSRELSVVAEFVQTSIEHNPELAATIRNILEGLVLYRAAFLPDVTQSKRSFSNLRVFFDSGIVRQALGYEGPELRALARETLDVLKAAGVQALVFDKTLHEIRRILAMYENKLATTEGQRSLRPSEMARHFLSQRYTPGDVAQMNALLEREVFAAGFQVAPTPERIALHTLDERALAVRLADPDAHDEDSPRVNHDVDCVAAILTLRHGHRSTKVEDAKALFVSSTNLVVRNVGRWFADQGESCVPPIVHIRALSNLAWLKRPAVVTDFKLREIVALCSAALRPSRDTWNRFLRHLDALRRTNSITSDEAAAIVVSGLVDRLLSEAELMDGDSGPDAEALDDVVERVKASYAEEAKRHIATVEAARDAALAAAQEREGTLAREAVSSAERLREVELSLDGRARSIARRIAAAARWGLSVVVLAGAAAIAVAHPAHRGWIGFLIAGVVVVFLILEVLGIMHHLAERTQRLEVWLTTRLRHWLVPGLGGSLPEDTTRPGGLASHERKAMPGRDD
jgi:hypothetical protein